MCTKKETEMVAKGKHGPPRLPCAFEGKRKGCKEKPIWNTPSESLLSVEIVTSRRRYEKGLESKISEVRLRSSAFLELCARGSKEGRGDTLPSKSISSICLVRCPTFPKNLKRV